MYGKMKRVLALILMAVLVLSTFAGCGTKVGDTIMFGGYEWLVLDKQDGQALIITKGVIEERAYNDEVEYVTWETCTLRSYLNNYFYNTFSETDKARIVQTTNVNEDNQWFGTVGGNRTGDKIFLLSLSEVVRYFGDSGQLKDRPDDDTHWIDDQYNEARIAEYGGRRWWLRSPGGNCNDAAGVNLYGDVRINGHGVYYESGGVRPALWLNL